MTNVQTLIITKPCKQHISDDGHLKICGWLIVRNSAQRCFLIHLCFYCLQNHSDFIGVLAHKNIFFLLFFIFYCQRILCGISSYTLWNKLIHISGSLQEFHMVYFICLHRIYACSILSTCLQFKDDTCRINVIIRMTYRINVKPKMYTDTIDLPTTHYASCCRRCLCTVLKMEEFLII